MRKRKEYYAEDGKEKKQDLGLKCSAWKVFSSKEFGLVGLYQKMFVQMKILGAKIIFGSKKVFESKKNFGLKKVFWPKKVFGFKKLFGSKKIFQITLYQFEYL